MDLQSVKTYIGRFLDAGYYIHQLMLAGGEPFVNQDLESIVEYVDSVTGAGYIKILSNGTVPIDNRMIGLLAGAQSTVLWIDDYGNKLSKQQREIIEDNKRRLDENGVQYKSFKQNLSITTLKAGSAACAEAQVLLWLIIRTAVERQAFLAECYLAEKEGRAYSTNQNKEFHCAIYQDCLFKFALMGGFHSRHFRKAWPQVSGLHNILTDLVRFRFMADFIQVSHPETHSIYFQERHSKSWNYNHLFLH